MPDHTARVDVLNHLRRYGPTFLPNAGHSNGLHLHHLEQVEVAERQFQDFARSGLQVRDHDFDLLKYFQLRKAWELKQYERVGSTELLFLNQARRKYRGARYDELYSNWKRGDQT